MILFFKESQLAEHLSVQIQIILKSQPEEGMSLGTRPEAEAPAPCEDRQVPLSCGWGWGGLISAIPRSRFGRRRT